jgi:uncharacterized protein YndB with AHSA1/START domain
MITQKLEIRVALQIGKPANEVFEAIVNPQKMSNYFISKSTGRMESNKSLLWKFPEFDKEFPIRVDLIVKNEYISYFWNDVDGRELRVEMNLDALSGPATLVTVHEKSRENNEQGIRWLKSNTEGWANFLACLKAYLEFEINLRKGSFDFLKKN